ncbi:hypothetical protein PENANT_c007G03223 [Penicillium antarcticum]|uniref:Uncharacterized protein n=1 Tax=Penicillium antarcticum TaxID=416450 RepID=A0A1V6QBV5_9EURO|nr:hypothetical protein PENANT_c007G03223 [Penicillium antarcticum]
MGDGDGNCRATCVGGPVSDIMSVNTARGGEGKTVEVGLEPEGEVESKGCDGLDEDDQKSLEMEEYEKRLEQAIESSERAPVHFPQ